jgi:hypothetical protein
MEFTNDTSAVGVLIPTYLAIFNIEAFIPNIKVGLGFDYQWIKRSTFWALQPN